mmetsp:Transcript_27737/g.60421  ORF Transcript_27737/g.60421 Transcript_27737/m.60421 type:complete len:110 (-) Transcript_27737:51-380(-)
MMIALRCRKAAALIMALVLLRAATGSVACPQALHLLAATQNSVECIGSLLQGLPQLKEHAWQNPSAVLNWPRGMWVASATAPATTLPKWHRNWRAILPGIPHQQTRVSN